MAEAKAKPLPMKAQFQNENHQSQRKNHSRTRRTRYAECVISSRLCVSVCNGKLHSAIFPSSPILRTLTSPKFLHNCRVYQMLKKLSHRVLRRTISRTSLMAPRASRTRPTMSKCGFLFGNIHVCCIGINVISGTCILSQRYTSFLPGTVVYASRVQMQVMIRVRPTNDREIDLAGDACSLQERGSSSLHLRVDERAYAFKFDDVLGSDGSQEELFQRATVIYKICAPHCCCVAPLLLEHNGLRTSFVGGCKGHLCRCSCGGANGEQRHARIQRMLLCVWPDWRRQNTHNARRAPS